MSEECKEVYCLKWSGTGRIHVKECYIDIERAKRHVTHANKHLRWWHRLYGYRWILETLKVKEGSE